MESVILKWAACYFQTFAADKSIDEAAQEKAVVACSRNRRAHFWL